jgi:hypothetical protein
MLDGFVGQAPPTIYIFMKKVINKIVRRANRDMRADPSASLRTGYDFKGEVRGKHYRAMQAGYTIAIHKANGKTIVKDVMPKGDAVLLELDVQTYFPDSESVNKALRCLIPLLPKKHRAKEKY